MHFGMTIDDVCMPEFSSEEHLERTLGMLAELGIRATFFVVPLADGVLLGERPGYVALLKRALAAGHEVALHGLEHDRFEVGIPPDMVLSLPHEGPARERLARDRALIDESHTVPNICKKLRQGRQILEEALGVPVIGFRAPCLQICDNLFTALAEEGFSYDSSFPIQEAGWDLINGRLDAVRKPITQARAAATRRHSDLASLPMTTDYTWYLTEERYAATWAMARQDILDCRREGVPFVPLSHVSPIYQGDAGCGERLFRELVALAREEGCEFVPLREIATGTVVE